MPLKYLLSRYSVKPYDFSSAWKLFLGENPNTALWFIYILFLLSVLCVLLLNEKNLSLFLGISFLVSLLAYGAEQIWSEAGWLLRLPKYWFFFVLGIYIRKNYKKWRLIIQNIYLFAGAAAAFLAANVLSCRTEVPGIGMISSLGGILCCMFLAIQISDRKGWLSGAMSVLGKYSMDIYILSEPFNTVVRLVCWNLLGLNYLVCTACCFLAALFLPIPASKYIVRRVRLFRMLVLGMR